MVYALSWKDEDLSTLKILVVDIKNLSVAFRKVSSDIVPGTIEIACNVKEIKRKKAYPTLEEGIFGSLYKSFKLTQIKYLIGGNY